MLEKACPSQTSGSIHGPQAVEVKSDLYFEFSKKKARSMPLCLYMNIQVFGFQYFSYYWFKKQTSTVVSIPSWFGGSRIVRLCQWLGYA